MMFKVNTAKRVQEFTFARTSFEEMVGDIKPLISGHWKEIALFTDEIPLDPDYDRYQSMCDQGSVRLYGARMNGELIGYAIFMIVERHLHYRHRWALNDIIFIHPAHRNFGVGSGLCDCFESDLTQDGPIVINIATKTAHPALAMLLRSRGYGDAELSMSKRFGGV